MSGLIKKYVPQIGYFLFPNLRREQIGAEALKAAGRRAPVRLLVEAQYDEDPDRLFDRASDFADMMHVTRRIARFKHLPAARMEQGRTYTTDIEVFRFLHYARFEIRIDLLNPEDRVLLTFEGNRDVRSWKHRLDIMPTPSGAVWIDYLEIDAGLLTPFASLFARLMYAHRHKQRGAAKVRLRSGRKASAAHQARLQDRLGLVGLS